MERESEFVSRGADHAGAITDLDAIGLISTFSAVNWRYERA
jgi:hypothetical protein